MLTDDRMKELDAEFKKLGIAKIRARLANTGTYNIWETPYMKGLIEDYLSKRLKPIDIITIVFAAISILLAIYFGFENRQLQDNRQAIHNKAQIIQQYITTNNYNLPQAFIEAVDNIAIASGPVVKLQKSDNK